MLVGSLASDEPTALDKAVRPSTAINRNNVNCGFTTFVIGVLLRLSALPKQSSASLITLAKTKLCETRLACRRTYFDRQAKGRLFEVAVQFSFMLDVTTSFWEWTGVTSTSCDGPHPAQVLLIAAASFNGSDHRQSGCIW